MSSFDTQERVKVGHIKTTKQYKHFDWIATGHQFGKTIKSLPIPREKDVIFGGFWYLDFQKVEHEFRFVLRVGDKTTHPDIADEVDPEYTKWT